MADFVYDGPELETRYIPGSGADFVVFIQSLKDKAELKAIDGKFRWVVTYDKSAYIARPESAYE
jgi:hypothetical protein